MFDRVRKQLSACLMVCALAACAPQTPALAPAPADSFAQAMLSYRQHVGSERHWARVLEALGVPQTMAQGYLLQQSYVDLRSVRESRAGYKIALGNQASQALLGASEPITGILFANDLLPSGSRISVRGGVRLAVEADLLATIGSADVNQARTIDDVAKHIENLHAYIELPDLPFPFERTMASRFTATNAGAHLGIVGSTVKASSSPEFVDQLGAMQVILSTGATGDAPHVLARAFGRDLMAHPYNAVLFLLRKLQERGQALQAGDVISLGAYSKPLPVNGLLTGETLSVSVSYLGLVDHKTGNTASATVYFY